MKMFSPKLSIFARLPVPGEVKTRLIPALGPEGAARIYARLLAHTVQVAKDSGLDFELRVTGGEIEARTLEIIEQKQLVRTTNTMGKQQQALLQVSYPATTTLPPSLPLSLSLSLLRQ